MKRIEAEDKIEYEYIIQEELFLPHVLAYQQTVLHKNWVNTTFDLLHQNGETETILPRYELAEYIQCMRVPVYDLYEQVLQFQESFTLENASPLFAEVISDYVEFVSILENDYVKANVLKVIDEAYPYAGSTYCIVTLAQAIFGEQVKISFFLEETPKRVVFDNIASLQNMILSTPQGEAIATPDLFKIVASNIPNIPETIPVLNAFFQKFAMANFATVFEFNI